MTDGALGPTLIQHEVYTRTYVHMDAYMGERERGRCMAPWLLRPIQVCQTQMWSLALACTHTWPHGR